MITKVKEWIKACFSVEPEDFFERQQAIKDANKQHKYEKRSRAAKLGHKRRKERQCHQLIKS